MLVISGEKKEEHEEGEKEGNYYVSERRYGSFKRSIAVPEGIDHNKVDASFKKGVLTVVLQKTPESREKVKKIKVKASA
jgi:HSP20 family protein